MRFFILFYFVWFDCTSGFSAKDMCNVNRKFQCVLKVFSQLWCRTRIADEMISVTMRGYLSYLRNCMEYKKRLLLFKLWQLLEATTSREKTSNQSLIVWQHLNSTLDIATSNASMPTTTIFYNFIWWQDQDPFILNVFKMESISGIWQCSIIIINKKCKETI